MRTANFVETTLYHQARKEIEDKKTVLLLGGIGDGKTSIIEYIAANPMEGYLPVFYKKPKEIQQYIDQILGNNIRLLFISDDPVGGSYTQQQLVDNWALRLEDLEKCLTQNEHKFLFAMRKTVWADCKVHFEKSKLFCNKVEVTTANLNSEDKVRMLEKYLGNSRKLREREKQGIVESEKLIAYGQCCKLMGDAIEKDQSGKELVQIFQSPFSYLCSELKNMAGKEKEKYAILCLVMLCQGKLECKQLMCTLSDIKADVRERLDVVLDACALPNVHVTCGGLLKCAEKLSGTYLEKVHTTVEDSSTCEVYKFCHDSIHEAVTMEFAQLHLGYCLKYLNRDVVVNIARPHNYEKREQEFAINVPTDYYEKLAGIFTTKVIDTNGKWGLDEVFNNPCVKDEPFQIVWIDYLRKTSPDERTAFSQSKDRYDWCVLYYIAKSGVHKLLELIHGVHDNRHLVCKCRDEYDDLPCVLEGAVVGDHVHIVRSYWTSLTSTRDREEMTRIGLRTAAQYGSVRTIEWFLQTDYCTPCKGQDCLCVHELWRASVRGHTDLVRLFISSHGQNVNTTVYGGRTSLHWAAEYGQSDVVRFLLSIGADVNLRDDYRRTSLHVAVSEGHTEIVSILLDSGADVNLRDDYRRTSLDRAVSWGHTEIVSILLDSGADVNLRDDYRRTSLHVAVSEGHTEIVSILLDSGADVNLRDDYRRTSLDRAVSWGHTEIVSILLDSGADVNLRDGWSGRTSLDRAVSEGHTEIVSILLDSGADVNLRDNDGRTSLHMAASEGHTEIVNILLDSGADVNLRDGWSGRTSLDVAVSEGHTEIVDLLRLARGGRHGQQ